MTNQERIHKLRQCDCQRCKNAIGKSQFCAAAGGPVHRECAEKRRRA